MFASAELPRRSDAPILDAYVGHAQVVLDGLMAGLGNGSAQAITAADLAGSGPPPPDRSEMIDQYRAKQGDVDEHKTRLGALDSKVAEIAQQSAEVTNAAQQEVAKLYDIIADIVRAVPGKPTVAQQMDAIAGIDRAVGKAEEAVSSARDQLSEGAGGIAQPPVANFAASPTPSYPSTMMNGVPRSLDYSGSPTVSRRSPAERAASYASSGQASAPIGGSVERAREMIYRYLTDPAGHNLRPAQAAAIVANIEKESGFNPGVVNHGAGEKNSFGLCQWRDEVPGQGRYSNLVAFAQNRPGGIGNWQNQIDFILAEMNSTESAARGPFMAAADPRAAAWAFDRYYERSAGSRNPNSESAQSRQDLAESIARSMGSTAA
ncbi:phage tail tip lysozyme [Nocardia brasiliensis]|uniref:phage tail tip lysozyme n=1 Tax=Nocardia brasiliensis TaxID=37326 RepID=UPI0037AA7A25